MKGGKGGNKTLYFSAEELQLVEEAKKHLKYGDSFSGLIVNLLRAWLEERRGAVDVS